MPNRLEGKVALVTGGSRGIGRAVSSALASHGAAVIVNYATQADPAARLANRIREHGGRAAAIQADVSEKSQVEAMVAQALREFGQIDILVNNAGIFGKGTSLTMDDSEFDRLFAVNIKGVVHCVKAVAPGMISRRYGKIVNVSSAAALGNSVPESTPYAVSKAAVVTLTKRQALEFGPHNINVNCICPGFTQTEMLNFGDPPDLERLAALEKRAMLGRIGKPEDIASVVVFLASDESSFVTAQAITVDGGRTDVLSRSG